MADRYRKEPEIFEGPEPQFYEVRSSTGRISEEDRRIIRAHEVRQIKEYMESKRGEPEKPRMSREEAERLIREIEIQQIKEYYRSKGREWP